MGLRRRLRNALQAIKFEHPAWQTAIDTDWSAHDPAGGYRPVEQDFEQFKSACGIFPAFSACVTKIQALGSDVPWAIEDRADGERVQDHPLEELFRRPNPAEGQAFWKQKALQQLAYYGNLWISVEGPIERPTELWILEANLVKIIPSTSNAYPYQAIKYGGLRRTVTIPGERVIQVRRPNPKDVLYGLSFLAEADQVLKLLYDAYLLNRSLLRRGVRVGGILRVPRTTSPDEIAAIRAQLKAQKQGPERAGEPLIVRADEYEWTRDSDSMKDMEYQEMVRASNLALYNVTGLPAALFQDASEINRATVDAARAQAYTDCVRPLFSLITEQINAAPFMRAAGVRLVADWSAVEALQPNRLELIQGEEILLRTTATVPNETRKRLGLGEPVPWGEEPLSMSAPDPFGAAEEPGQDPPAQDPQPPDGDEEAQLSRGARLEDRVELEVARILAEDKSIELAALASGDSRSAKWVGISQRMSARMTRWIRKTRRLFGDLEDEVLDNLARYEPGVLAAVNGNGTAPVSLAEIPGGMSERPLFDFDEFVRRWTEAMGELAEGDIRAGAEAMLQEIGMKVPFPVNDPRIQEFIASWVAERVTKMGTTQKNTIKAVIAKVAEEGGTIEDAAKALREKFRWDRRVRSMMIARTEVAGLYNHGAKLGLEAAGISTKEWLSSRDLSVRPTHVEADGQAVRLDQPFRVGNAVGQAPGQMSTAAENVNCRCTIIAGSE